MRDNIKLKTECYWYNVDLLGLYSVEALKALSGSVNPPGHPRPNASEQVPKMKKSGIKGDWSRERKRKDLSSGSGKLECGNQEMTISVYCLWYLTAVNEVCLYSKNWGNCLPNARWDPNRSLKFGSWVRQAKRPSRSKTVESYKQTILKKEKRVSFEL